MNKHESVSCSELLPVGKVTRPHGLKGFLRIVSYSGSKDAIKDAGTVYFRSVSGETREYRVVSITAHKNIFLLDLEGLNSMDEAEAYRGAEIFIKKETEF